MTKVAVLGSGPVGQALADGLLKHGYEVVRGTREPGKLAEWKSKAGGKASTAAFADAAKQGELVILAVKGTGAESAVEMCGRALDGKTVIDTTNPIAEKPPIHGVLDFFTTFEQSLMERLQKKAPAAKFVKAFSCVGNALMVDPQLPGGPPTMFICGNDAGAKAQTKEILDKFGWRTEDMGAAEAARAIEPLCILWCIPGLTGGGWMHAFKLLRVG